MHESAEEYNRDEVYENGCRALRLGGLKLTPSRRYVLRQVINQPGPHSVQSLLSVAPADLSLDQSTIYRTISSLIDLDMISEVRLPRQRQTHYVWKHWEHHHHVVCRECGNVMHVQVCPRNEIESKVMEATGYSELEHHLEFSGICPKCKENHI